jgi:hypothetical protein
MFCFVIWPGSIFFKGPYQTWTWVVPAGLLMKQGRMVVKLGSGNIINPAGHCDSHADSL